MAQSRFGEPLTDLPLIAKVRSQSSGEIERGKRKEYIIKALIRQVERRDKKQKENAFRQRQGKL